jgi:ABC-2 type transport system permease protein
MKQTFRDHFRIVMAIAQKDITDGIKNKNIISLVLTAVFLLVMYRYLPAITDSIEEPYLAVYDTGESIWVEQWDQATDFQLRSRDTVEELKFFLSNLDMISLGLVLPADFDSQVGSTQTLTLTGYVAHWAEPADLAELTTFFDQRLSEITDQPIQITISDEYAYPDPNTKGPGFLASIAVAIISTMAGVMILSHLILEERQTKTLDMLRVSPASYLHLAVAKLIAGSFFGLILGAVALYANAYLVLHWPAAIVVVVLAIIFNTAMGLLIGTFIHSKQQLTIWSMVILNIMLIPAFLEIMDDIFPAAVISVFQWNPAVAVTHGMRISYAQTFDLGLYLPRIGLLLGYTVLLTALIVYRLRREER